MEDNTASFEREIKLELALHDAQATIAGLKQQLADAQYRREKAEEDVDSIADDRQRLITEKMALRDELQQAQATIAGLHNSVDVAARGIVRLTEERDTAKANGEFMAQRMVEQGEALAAFEATLNETIAKLEASQAACERLNAAQIEAEQILERKEEELEKTRCEDENQQATIQRLEEALRAADRELQNIQWVRGADSFVHLADYRSCPSCGCSEKQGHPEGCNLARVRKQAEQALAPGVKDCFTTDHVGDANKMVEREK